MKVGDKLRQKSKTNDPPFQEQTPKFFMKSHWIFKMKNENIFRGNDRAQKQQKLSNKSKSQV